MPAWLIPALTAGASLLSQAWNNHSVRKTNAEQKRYNEEMYAKQRADNERQWHMQNEYNSPTGQMTRARAAGLNPMFIFGSGSGGGTASSMVNTSAASYSPTAPQVNMGETMGKYFDAKIRQAQYDNLKAQNTVLLEEAALKRANTEYIQSRDSMANYDLEYKMSNRQNFEDLLGATAHGKAIDNAFKRNEDMRREALTAANLAQAVERIASMQLGRKLTAAEIQRVQNDTQLQRQSLELGQLGLYKDAPWMLKAVGTWINKLFPDLFK